jgi:hypothetical protein
MKINRNEKTHRKISELCAGAVFTHNEEVYMLIVGIDTVTYEFNAVNLISGESSYFDGHIFVVPCPNAVLDLG